MTELREKVALLIEPYMAEDDWGDGLHLNVADEILALPEIAEALHIHAVLDEQIAAELLEVRNPSA